MAKKTSDGAALGILLVIGLVVAAVSAAVDWVRQNLLLAGLIAVGIALFLVVLVHGSSQNRKRRYESLVARFGSEEIATDIMNRCFWIGQTSEQLRESLGAPLAIDRQLLKTKHKEVWKYNEVRKNQYGLKITLENDRVVGWDKKG